MASPDFRTPLSGILSSVSLIARYNEPEELEKRQKHINTIKASVQNLTNILNDFLSLDKIDQGKIECHPSVFTLTHFLDNLLEELKTIPQQEERISHVHRGGEGEVTLDKDMLRNVLTNLLFNALKYSGSDQKVYFTTDLDDKMLTITVQDEGIGIPQSEQKHLFGRFFRARNAVHLQGTGLGLNIVKRYLDLMNGSIHFTSQENRGTTFTVVLPRRL
jgi:signal transduction histidine kinase